LGGVISRGSARNREPGRPEALGHPRDLTARWLTAVLRHAGVRSEVSGFRWRRIGADTGIGSFVTRVELRYRHVPPEDAPGSLVIKFPRHPDWVDVAVVERRFYLEHAGTWPFRTPRCYYAALNRRGRRWTLVLEDLGSHRPLDDIEGVPIEDAERIVESRAAMHAWGRRPGAGLEWLASPDPQSRVRMRYYERYHEQGIRRLRGFLPRQHLALFRGLAGVERAAIAMLADEPLTAVHADFRGDNLFMTADRTPIAVDWEGLWHHRGGAELGRFFVTSLRPEVLRRDGEALIRRYSAVVQQHGMTEYPSELIERDVRLGMVRHMVQSVAQLHEADLGRGRPLRVVRTWAMRADAAVRQFDALSAVPGSADASP
jgi:hypothetical protein